MFEKVKYIEILKEHFEFRKMQNPSYSLRAFARDLEIAPSNLSDIIKNKKGLSLQTATKISKKLKLSNEEKEKFITLVESKCARSKKTRQVAQVKLSQFSKKINKDFLQEDAFKLISDWYHYAILELMTVENFKSDSNWIAKELGIQKVEARNAIERLIRLNLIKKNTDGRYISTNVQLEANYGIPSLEIQKFNQQILNKAMKAITNQSIKERDLSSLTIAINTEDLDYIKSRIQDFKFQLDKEIMERTKIKGANKVYCFSSQFFSLQEQINE